ncbi:MAG: hypothetical protein AAF539_04680 [Planctomycetota bacterium]
MRKRVPIAIGVVAVAVASQFVDFGLGFQQGGDPEEPTEVRDEATPDRVAIDADSMIVEPTEESSPTTEPQIPEVVDIRIDGEQYWVITDASNPESRVPLTLDEITSLIAEVPGEANGIKVRVTRTANAIALAEAGLITHLRESGINDDQVDSRRQLVE